MMAVEPQMADANESGRANVSLGWGERKRGRKVMKESDIQALTLQEQFRSLIAALPRGVKEKKPAEIVYTLISDLEQRQMFPEAPYVLGGRLLTPGLARLIENRGKHWVGQLEGHCPIQWAGPWLALDQVAKKLQKESPDSFRAVAINRTDGTSLPVYLFSRSVRLDHYGRKRIVILHEAADFTDTPVFLFTDALFWEAHRIAQLWQYHCDERLID